MSGSSIGVLLATRFVRMCSSANLAALLFDGAPAVFIAHCTLWLALCMQTGRQVMPHICRLVHFHDLNIRTMTKITG